MTWFPVAYTVFIVPDQLDKRCLRERLVDSIRNQKTDENFVSLTARPKVCVMFDGGLSRAKDDQALLLVAEREWYRWMSSVSAVMKSSPTDMRISLHQE